MLGIVVKRAPGTRPGRGLLGVLKTWAVASAAAACICVLARAAHAGAPPAVPPQGEADAEAAPAATSPAPKVVTPGTREGAPDAPAAAAGPLVVGGVDERTGSLELFENKTATLVTSRPYKRLSVGNEQIADVTTMSTTRILVTAKKAGSTHIIVWDENDNSQQIDVIVQANLSALRSLYEKLLPGTQIDIIDNQGTIALTGQVPNLATADQAAALASGFGQKVINLLEVAGGQQVMLQVRFAEVSKTAVNELGVNLGFSDGRSFGASNIGQVTPFGIREVGENASDLGIINPNPNVTLFGRAVMGQTALIAYIAALRQNNLLRILAEPNLVTTSGQEADFLAGGDFPVPIVQGGNDQGTSITVEFREFGVRLRFTPVVLGNGRIRLKMSPEVSDVDFTNAVESAGFRIPGRRTRRLSTTVELEEGQTFAVGGLLDNRVAANKSVTPLLGDVPVLGALFRSVRYQRQETELVVLVTPRLVSGLQPGQVNKLPGEHWRHPNEFGLYLFGDIGDEVQPEEADKLPARRFIGSYGFVPAP